MTTMPRSSADQWINDYLDLYLYASRIGDGEWQEELLRTLSQYPERIAREAEDIRKEDLRRQYEAVTFLLEALYTELRETPETARDELMQRLLVLKQQRHDISRMLDAAG